MSAAGGDRHFAPGAAYRRGGFDRRAWIKAVNAVLKETRPGYEVCAEGYSDRPPGMTLVSRVNGRAVALTRSIQPEETSIQAVESMIDVYERAMKVAAREEASRLYAAQHPDRVLPRRNLPRGRSRPRVEEPEEAAAPGMRP
jgi:hypothetical protein